MNLNTDKKAALGQKMGDRLVGRCVNGGRQYYSICPLSEYRARPVYRFAICYLGQDRGQRLWSAKSIKFLEFYTRYAFNLNMRPDTASAECYNVLSSFFAIFRCHIPLESESSVLSPQQLRCCQSRLCGFL